MNKLTTYVVVLAQDDNGADQVTAVKEQEDMQKEKEEDLKGESSLSCCRTAPRACLVASELPSSLPLHRANGAPAQVPHDDGGPQIL